MEIRIIETNELKELNIFDANGINWINDLLGNNDATKYNQETEEHEMSSENFEWWGEYINNHDTDEKEIAELAEELGIEKSEIYDRINENITCDLGDEHMIKQSVMETLIAERV